MSQTTRPSQDKNNPIKMQLPSLNSRTEPPSTTTGLGSSQEMFSSPLHNTRSTNTGGGFPMTVTSTSTNKIISSPMSREISVSLSPKKKKTAFELPQPPTSEPPSDLPNVRMADSAMDLKRLCGYSKFTNYRNGAQLLFLASKIHFYPQKLQKMNFLNLLEHRFDN